VRRFSPLVGMMSLALSGCGVFFTHAPPPGHEQMTSFHCSTDNVGPWLDVVAASLSIIGGIAATPASPGYGESSGEELAIGIVWAGVLGASATVGFSKVTKCRAARRALAEREEQARTAGVAPDRLTPGAPIDSVRINPAVDTISAGGMVQLTATAFGSGGTRVPISAFKWSSSDESVAWVTRTGLVQSQAPGSVVIAANANNVVGTATVVVTAP